MADVFAEIDEIMRQERMAKLWKDYGSVVVAFVVICILGTAAFSGYKAWNASVRVNQTGQISDFQNASDYPENILSADLTGFRGPLRGIALLSAAGAFVQAGEQDNAISLYKRVVEDKGVPPTYRQLADIMLVRFAVDAPDADSADLRARLDAIIEDPRSPWQAHAKLEAAVVLAHLDKDYRAARARLDGILAEEDLPQSLKQKAQALDHLYALNILKAENKEAENEKE